VGGSSSSSIVSARDVCSGCVGSHTEWQTRDKLVVYVCVCVCVCVVCVVVVGGTLLPAATLYYIYIHTYIHTYYYYNNNNGGYLVDPASSHMLVSKIKPCMSKYKLVYTARLRMAH
jgi:hypothetical protein